MTESRQQERNQMGSKKMLPLIISMAVPPMLSMLIQSLYNIVDSIFVARVSEEALSAVSIIFPIQNLALSIAVGLGIGLNSYIARNLGAGDTEKVDKACTMGFFLTLIHYILIALLGILCMKPFVAVFAKTAEVASLCYDYGYIIVLFSFGQLFHIMIEKMFQATGKMLIPMALQGIGCVVNLVMDPILIFGLFGCPVLGVKGAAIATVMGQIVSCVLSMILLVQGKGGLKLHRIHWDKKNLIMVKQVYAVALPSTLIMALPSILIAGLNGILVSFSAVAVSVFGIYYKLQTFVYMPANGLIQGVRPIISYNYGAGDQKREKEALGISIGIVGTIMLLGTMLFWFFPVQIMDIFKSNKEMKEMGVLALRIISIGFLPSTLGILAGAVFESIGKGVQSLIITMLRQLVIILPVSIVCSRFLGLMGVWISFPIAEIIAAVLAVLLLKKELKNTIPMI
ncbi:MAG: MATE family efflux transporter [Lachnospiraceae bacterium]